ISEKTGIVVKRCDFCDPQGGKGRCDRCAAIIKSIIRRYLNENHNVTTASEFVEACHSYKGVKGVHAFDCRIEDTAMKMYHSKLEEVENRRIISIDMNLTEAIADETNLLPKGWALPIRKPNTGFSDKQHGYL
ncbi:unnamed protein product, partial [Rotaria sordida]